VNLERFSLEGKTALVTGCRRGIGLSLARALAEAGSDIIGVSASLEKSGSRVEMEVVNAGRRFKGYSCDFANRGSLKEFIGKVNSDFPEIDILVNNAGTIQRTPAETLRDEDWDRVIEINLNAQFILTREVARGMLGRGRGKIIFIASLLTFQGGILVPAYAASKGGIGQLTKALSNEWAPRGVQVNAIAPGYMETDNTVELRNDEERSRSILSRIPAGRWGAPGDLAGTVVYLSSAASDYVSGIILPVDGGWLAR
jgi:2-dehydro-3-deoxy-D-gluconate 5-dehydrogenase